MPQANNLQDKVSQAQHQAEQGANRVQGLIHWFTWQLDPGKQEHIIEVLKKRVQPCRNGNEFTNEEIESFIRELNRLLPHETDTRIHACFPDAPRHFSSNGELMTYVKRVNRAVTVCFLDAEHPEQSKLFRVFPNGNMQELLIKAV